MVFGECAPVHPPCVVAETFRLGAWAGTLAITFRDWRSNRSTRPRDPPFEHPEVDEGDEESTYEVVPPPETGCRRRCELPFC
jgi:hypothetical protein